MFTRIFLLVNIFHMVLSYDGWKSAYETAQIIQDDGYVSETHGVLTSDGYMLEIHRIPFKGNQTSGPPDRPVVFLMHGLLAASNSFIYLGPQYSISYNLADAGFDVWMGNARGTKNSRQHYNFDPDSPDDRKKFFDFTWEQIALYDVSAMMDYILDFTNNTQLHYVGHSQGGTVFLVLNSMMPEYNQKFASAHLLAGVGYMEHFPHKLLSGLASFTNTIYSLALRMGIVEIFPPNANGTNSTRRESDSVESFDYNCGVDDVCKPSDLCSGDVKQKEMCDLFGVEEIMSQKILDNLLTDYEPGGAALKQVAHYGQNIQDQTFRRWNYGPMENFQKYGSSVPPRYNLSLIKVDTTMHYTVGDTLLDEKDVLNMCNDMPKCRARKIARESFAHVDFVVTGDVKELVTDYMIDAMLNKNNDENTSISSPSPETVISVTSRADMHRPSDMIGICFSSLLLYCTLFHTL